MTLKCKKEAFKMAEVKIIKQKMDIGEKKDVENSIAKAEKYDAFMEYIAICDHPEILEDEEEMINE